MIVAREVVRPRMSESVHYFVWLIDRLVPAAKCHNVPAALLEREEIEARRRRKIQRLPRRRVLDSGAFHGMGAGNTAVYLLI